MDTKQSEDPMSVTTRLDHRHALKWDLLSKQQQARALATLERKARAYSKSQMNNAASSQADLYSWHRRVRVAREARALHLFRAFLKGTAYKRVESRLTSHSITPIEVYLSYMSMNPLTFGLSSEFDKWCSE